MTPSTKISLSYQATPSSADPPRASPHPSRSRCSAPRGPPALGCQPLAAGSDLLLCSPGRAAAAALPPRPHVLHGPRPCRERCRCPGLLACSALALPCCTLRCSTRDQARSRSARRPSRTSHLRIACGIGRERCDQFGKPPVGRTNKNSTPPRPRSTIGSRQRGTTRGAIRLQPGRPSHSPSTQHPTLSVICNFSASLAPRAGNAGPRRRAGQKPKPPTTSTRRHSCYATTASFDPGE